MLTLVIKWLTVKHCWDFTCIQELMMCFFSQHWTEITLISFSSMQTCLKSAECLNLEMKQSRVCIICQHGPFWCQTKRFSWNISVKCKYLVWILYYIIAVRLLFTLCVSKSVYRKNYANKENQHLGILALNYAVWSKSAFVELWEARAPTKTPQFSNKVKSNSKQVEIIIQFSYLANSGNLIMANSKPRQLLLTFYFVYMREDVN